MQKDQKLSSFMSEVFKIFIKKEKILKITFKIHFNNSQEEI